MSKAQLKQIEALRRAIHALRSAIGISELPSTWIDVLLLIASGSGTTLSTIEQRSGLATSSAQRVLLALGNTSKLGKPGLGLIENIVDPRHGIRKLYFLNKKGEKIVDLALTELHGKRGERFVITTSGDFLSRIQSEQASVPSYVDPKAFSSQAIIVGKRALKRKGVTLGNNVVAFPLIPASGIIDEIAEWVELQKGRLYCLPTIGKPLGMVLVDLPSSQEQIHFHFRWRGPVKT